MQQQQNVPWNDYLFFKRAHNYFFVIKTRKQTACNSSDTVHLRAATPPSPRGPSDLYYAEEKYREEPSDGPGVDGVIY